MILLWWKKLKIKRMTGSAKGNAASNVRSKTKSSVRQCGVLACA